MKFENEANNLNESSIYENRWIILIVIIAFVFMAQIDASIVNVALPDMAQKLHVGTASISWVITIYFLTIIAFIIFFGKLADLTGQSWVFRLGMVLFTIGSLCCGLSNTLPLLLGISRGTRLRRCCCHGYRSRYNC